MGRVGSWGAVAAAGLALAACGDARLAESPLAGSSSCASCHTAPGEGPPFRDQTGSTDPIRLTIGAHDAHLHAKLAAPLACGDCHRVPQALGDPGHLDRPPEGNVHFGPLARSRGANPVYVDQGCQASYCHGNFPGGKRDNGPRWLAGPGAAACGSCHTLPPPSGRHPEHAAAGIRCDQCHGPFVQATHVNGIVDVPLQVYDRRFQTCAQACHTPRAWPGEGDAER
jgi:predicted CxxxxCH...CXXCH cytochrome family protein